MSNAVNNCFPLPIYRGNRKQVEAKENKMRQKETPTVYQCPKHRPGMHWSLLKAKARESETPAIRSQINDKL